MTSKAPIAALASGSEPAAVALIRMSGKGCFDLIKDLIRTKGKATLAERQMRLCDFLDPKTGEIIDEPMISIFNGPRSFTGEDSAEVYCHGSPYIISSILKILYSAGFRQADPGEFTRRAFLNGKLDLTAAEGIKELVEAQSHQQWLAARQLATGTLKLSIDSLRKLTIEAMAYLEAQIDFPEEGDTADVGVSDVEIRVNKVEAEIARLIATYESGKVASHGLSFVLMGSPNSGKSTLMNHLLGQDRAIVTDIPGTTRDYLEESCQLKGRLIRIIDVAGIRDTNEKVESMGVERAKELAKNADIIAFLSPSDDLNDSDYANMWLNDEFDGKAIKLATKCDLQSSDSKKDSSWINISCKTGDGIDALVNKLVSMVDEHVGQIKEGAFITSARHAAALDSAQDSLINFKLAVAENVGEELLAFELQGVNRALKSIIGEVDSEDILDKIFSQFCVGK
jgi:tRNA modification GTPase